MWLELYRYAFTYVSTVLFLNIHGGDLLFSEKDVFYDLRVLIGPARLTCGNLSLAHRHATVTCKTCSL